MSAVPDPAALPAHALKVVLLQPQIAPNTGNVARLCVDRDDVKFSHGLPSAQNGFDLVAQEYVEAVGEFGFSQVALLMSRRKGDAAKPDWNVTYANARWATWRGAPIPTGAPLATLLPSRTIFLTSLSKSLFPGMRLGCAHATPAIVEKLTAAVSASIGTSRNHGTARPALEKSIGRLVAKRFQLIAMSAGAQLFR